MSGHTATYNWPEGRKKKIQMHFLYMIWKNLYTNRINLGGKTRKVEMKKEDKRKYLTIYSI